MPFQKSKSLTGLEVGDLVVLALLRRRHLAEAGDD